MMSSSDDDSTLLNDDVEKWYNQKVVIHIHQRPDRICKDIPFRTYHSAQRASPVTYIKFLKEMEKSTSRLDFLFWLFDIICSGYDADEWGSFCISCKELDLLGQSHFPLLKVYLAYCDGPVYDLKLSKHIKAHYPYLVTDGGETLLTFESKDHALVKYRNKEFQLISEEKKLYNMLSKNLFLINPMEGLTDADFLQNPPEPNYEDEDFETDEEDLLYMKYHSNLLTYNGPMKDSNDCILENKNDYKKMQVNAKLKSINFNRLIPLHVKNRDAMHGSKEIVLVRLSTGLFKRVMILGPASSNPVSNVCVYFVDDGIFQEGPKQNFYFYDFGKENLPTLSVIVPRNELPEDLKVGDMFVTGENGKYVCCGRVPEQSFETFLRVDAGDTVAEDIEFDWSCGFEEVTFQ